jgi:hypothetical protein
MKWKRGQAVGEAEVRVAQGARAAERGLAAREQGQGQVPVVDRVAQEVVQVAV